MHHPEHNFSPPMRNQNDHPAREVIDRSLEPLAAALYEHFHLTPNHISLIGALLVTLSAAIQEYSASKHSENSSASKIVLLFYALGSCFDKLDGVMAKFFKKNGLSHDSLHGGLLDTLIDRWNELVLAHAQMHTARQQKDSLALTAAFLNGVTSMLPSFWRALAEAQEREVPEGGRGLGVVGTRSARGVIGLFTFSPKLGVFPVQKIGNLLGTTANVSSSLDRMQIALAPKNVQPSPALDSFSEAELEAYVAEQLRLEGVGEKGKLKLKYQTLLAAAGVLFLYREYRRMKQE